MPIDRTTNALKWYKYGIEHEKDFIGKFIMHWIAFNWMYSECSNGSERQNIKSFCWKPENRKKLALYDPFETDAIEIFKKDAVLNVGGEVSNDDPKELWQSIKNGRDNSTERAINLLLTIYQVRCNLFHGSKRTDDGRDLALVESSAEIMQGYLRALLSDQYYFFH